MESKIDISEVTNSTWIKLDKLMRLPVAEGYQVQIGDRAISRTKKMSRVPSIAEVANDNIVLCDYIDNLQIGFSAGKLVIETMVYQTIDPDYKPDHRFRIVAMVFLNDGTIQGQRLPVARAGIAGPTMNALREYIEEL